MAAAPGLDDVFGHGARARAADGVEDWALGQRRRQALACLAGLIGGTALLCVGLALDSAPVTGAIGGLYVYGMMRGVEALRTGLDRVRAQTERAAELLAATDVTSVRVSLQAACDAAGIAIPGRWTAPTEATGGWLPLAGDALAERRDRWRHDGIACLVMATAAPHADDDDPADGAALEQLDLAILMSLGVAEQELPAAVGAARAGATYGEAARLAASR